jgi:glycosyltransferase involved in cell wall biosynthesis
MNRPASPEIMSHEPQLTVVVCTHNRYEVLPDALASLRQQSMSGRDLEVLVVDNSTDIDQQGQFWGSFYAATNFKLVVERIPGLSRARNIGLRTARAPIVAFMDDDALASQTWCEAIANSFKLHEDAGIVGGPVEPIWHSPRPSWLHRYQEGFLTILDRGSTPRKLEPHEWLAGTNIAFRRKLLEAAGGFNESLGRIGGSLLSNEELAITRKIHEAGYFSYYEPRATVLHRVHVDRLSQQWLRRRVSWQAVSDLLSDPQAMDAEAQWNRLADYFHCLSPEMRGMRGLLLNTPDADLFQKQCQAIQAVIHLFLNSGKDPLEKLE